MIPTINDRISWLHDLPALRRGAFSTISAMQTEPNQGVQYLGPLTAVAVMAETLGRDPHNDLVRVRKMIGDADSPFAAEIQAIRDYAQGELLNV